MTTQSISPPRNIPSSDELETIEGIGPEFARTLHDIGVQTFVDLAQYTPDELSQVIAERLGKDVGAEKIEADDWIGQAKNLAASLYDGDRPPIEGPRSTAADNENKEESEVEHGATDEIRLQRGGRDAAFRKVKDRFAVRLKQGRAAGEAALISSLGAPFSRVRHLDSVAAETMDVFGVEDATKLEQTMDRLRQSPAAEIVTHVYALENAPGSEMVPTGTMTIQFKPEVPKGRREELLAEFGLEVVEDLEHFLPNGHTVRLTLASTENPLKIGLKLQQRTEIQVAEPDFGYRGALLYRPTDPLYERQWHLKNRGDRLGLVAGADVKAEEAWDITPGGRREITICVIDDGFDLGHPDFSAPGKIVSPRDFGDGDFDPNPELLDENHGTACAGVALAEENGSGVVGLAYRCSFMPIRWSPWLTDDVVVGYFQYALDHHADVVSCSWSAQAWNFPLSTKMHAIIRYAATRGRRNGKGCVILFAAGNEDRPLDGTQNGRRSVQGFALHPDVIAVGASDGRDKRSSYCNYGPELTICAPSSGSRRITTTDRRGIHGYNSSDYTHRFGGTSSATPLAAGLAALILSVNEDLSAAEVRQIMMETADAIDSDGGDYRNGHSPWYGRGRINAHRAVQAAEEAMGASPAPEGGARSGWGERDVEELNVSIEIVDFDLSLVEPATHGESRSLRAGVRFELLGRSAAAVAEQHSTFCVGIYTIEARTGLRTLVASVDGTLQKESLDYTSHAQFGVPNAGVYQTEAEVRVLLTSTEIVSRRQGRTLRVSAN